MADFPEDIDYLPWLKKWILPLPALTSSDFSFNSLFKLDSGSPFYPSRSLDQGFPFSFCPIFLVPDGMKSTSILPPVSFFPMSRAGSTRVLFITRRSPG